MKQGRESSRGGTFQKTSSKRHVLLQGCCNQGQPWARQEFECMMLGGCHVSTVGRTFLQHVYGRASRCFCPRFPPVSPILPSVGMATGRCVKVLPRKLQARGGAVRDGVLAGAPPADSNFTV